MPWMSRVRWRTHRRFSGSFSHGKKDGSGVYTTAGGTTYEGLWADGKRVRTYKTTEDTRASGETEAVSSPVGRMPEVVVMRVAPEGSCKAEVSGISVAGYRLPKNNSRGAYSRPKSASTGRAESNTW